MKKISLLLCTLLLAACDNQPTTVTITPETQHAYPEGAPPQEPYVHRGPPASAYANPGDPENLMDVSSEVVNMSLASRGALSEISRVIAQDPPTNAELNCLRGEALCMEAKTIFENHGIPVAFNSSGDGVALIYKRVVARDCENRYIDNSKNPYNLHPPTFGCSLRANTVQMVGDKQQLINPSLMDYQDGEKAVQTVRRYQQPPKPTASKSLLKTISQ